MFTLIGFCFFTLLLFYLSRRALRKVGSHGFYRFFAWEALLVLIFLNADAWFKDPLSWYQDISWVLLIISLILAAEGFRLLRRMGGHHALREDPTLMGFEKTEHLVTSGLYAYIRHPLYGSLLLLTWGVFFKDPSWIGTLLGIAASVLLLATSMADEQECLRFFGPPYAAYMAQTKRFIPFVF